jgi:hypothetical protein
MALVGFLLLSRTLGAHLLALFVRRVGDFVFHPPPEAVQAFGVIGRARRQVVGDVLVVVLFVIAVGGDDVVVCWHAVEALDFRSLLGGDT